jgi:type I restriction enzyme M protein
MLSNTGIYTKTREIILQKFEIIAITALGSNTFMATGTNTVILFLRRRKDSVVRNIEEGIAAFLDCLKDITIGGVENAVSKYARAVWNVSAADYATLHKKEPNEAVKETALYKEYHKSFPREELYFDDNTPFAILDKMKEKHQEAVKRYWENITALETEKMLYFILAYPQKTVLVKTGEKDAEKRFLGYEFSNRRGFEGIHPVERGKTINDCTKLFDDERFDNPEKASAYIYKAFSGDCEYPIHEGLKNNISRVRLVDMFVFDRKDFEKTISIGMKNKLSFESIWNINRLVPIIDIAEIKKGASITKQQTVDGDIPVVAGGQEIAYYHNESNREGDIITISASGAYAGFVNYFEKPIFASDCNTIKSKNESIISTKLIYWLLKSIQQVIYTYRRGHAQPHIYADDIAKIKIPLPPKDIQEKIVAEIAALEEKEKHAADRIASLKEDISALFLFAANVKMEKLGNIACLLKRGKSAKYGKSNIQIIKSGQARGYREFDFSERHFVDESFVLDERKLQKDDILINSTGVGTAGRVTLFNLDGDFVVDSHITILRVNTNVVNPTFVLYVLAENIGFKNIEAMAQGQSGQIELSLSIIQNIKIPLPPLAEQQKIVAEIENLEGEIQNLQEVLEQTDGQKELVLNNYLH